MVKKIIFGIAIVIWLGVIYYFSAMDASSSTVESRGVTRQIVNIIIELEHKLGIIDEKPSEKEIYSMVVKINPTVRKLAHATVYFILAFLVLFAMDTKRENFWRNATIAVIVCFVYAMTDEYHQTFVPGRAGELRDCLIDTSGAIVACCLYKFGIRLFDRRIY